MKSIIESIKNINESSYTVNDKNECGYDLHAAVDYNGDCGVAIGGIFAVDDEDGRKNAESLIKKLGFSIGYSLDDFMNDEDLTGDNTVVYFLHTGSSSQTGFDDRVDCYLYGSAGVEILNVIK